MMTPGPDAANHALAKTRRTAANPSRLPGVRQPVHQHQSKAGPHQRAPARASLLNRRFYPRVTWLARNFTANTPP